MRLDDLQRLGTTARTARLNAFVRSAKGPPNDGLAALDAEIQMLETQHDVKSTDLRAAMRSGKVKDTGAVARWLVLLDARDRATR